MKDYVFLSENGHPFRASILDLDARLKAVTQKVIGVTIAHHSEPPVVFVHCREPLLPEERQAIQSEIRVWQA